MTKFELTEKEQWKADEFKEKHRHKDVNKGAIGGHISYHFTPNSVFRSVSIHCSVCGEEEDITNYDCW